MNQSIRTVSVPTLAKLLRSDRDQVLTGQESEITLLLIDMYDIYSYYGLWTNQWHRVYEAFFPFYETALQEIFPDFETLAHSIGGPDDYQECSAQLYREAYDLVCEYEGRAPYFIEPP